jgi:hypothetical protein
MSTNQNQDKTQPDGDRIGEGNPDAARRYNEGVEKTVKEGDQLRRAEEQGKKG